MEKLKSRKFWICVAAFLASIGTSIAGLRTDNQTVAAVGTICTIASAAIYAFAEAWVDSKAAVPNYDDTKALVEEYYKLLKKEEDPDE